MGTSHTEQPRNYRLLVDPIQRVQYVQLTSALVDQAIAAGVDDIVFLDKSARPISWFVRELWDLLILGHEEPSPPWHRFINLDRQMWRDQTGGAEEGSGVGVALDTDALRQDAADLREAFRVRLDRPERQETFFTGRTVMVVDEVRVSGDTLTIARSFLEAAFPDAGEILTAHWMTPRVTTGRGGVRYNSNLPIWYSDQTSHGRGVGDRDIHVSARSAHARTRAGKRFFSTRPDKDDQRSADLRNDIRLISSAIRTGDQPLRLNAQIPDEVYERRLEAQTAINGGLGPREITAFLSRAARQPERFADLWRQARQG